MDTFGIMQGCLNRIIGLQAKQCTGVPSFTIIQNQCLSMTKHAIHNIHRLALPWGPWLLSVPMH